MVPHRGPLGQSPGGPLAGKECGVIGNRRCHQSFGGRAGIAGMATILVIFLVAHSMAGAAPVAARTPAAVGPTYSHYELEVEFDPEARSLDGEMSVSWRNSSGQPLDVLHFRPYPNACCVRGMSIDWPESRCAPFPALSERILL